MPYINVADVIVNRDHRIRKVVLPDAIAALAESIKRHGGLINPITLTEHNELIAGETRLEAHKLLGFAKIEYKRWEELDARQRLAIEFEENVKRTDLPWQDQVDALGRFHALNRQDDPDWTTQKTAEAIGLSTSHVLKMLAVADEVGKGNARVSAAPKLSTAISVTQRTRERRASDELAKLKSVTEEVKPDSPILNLDFNEWAPTYEGVPFNFLHCDFPYGIDAQDFNQTANAGFGGYDDSFATYVRLLDTLEEHRDRLLGESAHCLFWFSFRHYQYTRDRLEKIFTWLDPYPLTWVKSDNKGTLPDPQRGPRRITEVAFFCSLGDRKIVTSVSNAFSAPTVRLGEHMSEKSQLMLEYFFKMVIDGNSRVLDPTAGSGSALRAARSLGAASILGLEVNAEFAENARRSLG